MLRVGGELIAGTVIEAEKRTDVRSKNLCKSKNNIRLCKTEAEIIVIFLEHTWQHPSKSDRKKF
jgi:hypothetical protein